MTVLRRADGRETTLHADRTTLGRAPGCDLVLDDPAVALRHASILRTDRGWLLVDESGGAGVQVDGVSVANHFLRDGETLRIGSTDLAFSDRGATLLGTPRPPLRPALELEGLRGVPMGTPPSSTPTTPGTPRTLPPSSAPAQQPRVPTISGRTLVPAPIAAPPPYAGAPPEDAPRSDAPRFEVARADVPRSTASIYEPPSRPLDRDDRPFVTGAAPRRAASVYTLGDDGPRASLDPVVDVYTLGRPGSAGASRSVYSMGTAPTHPGGPPASDSAAYSIGEAETILPPGGGHVPYVEAPREPDRRAAESWSWVQPEPARRRGASALGRPGRGLVTIGLALVVLGLVLVGIAFALGLTVAEVSSALLGGR